MTSYNTLKERMVSYEETTDLKLTKKLPIILSLNGRGFRKTTSLLDKPFSEKFNEIICGTLIKLASDIDGTSLLYSFNDEIIIVIKNNQSIETEAWYDNNVQKMVSSSASLASVIFHDLCKKNNLDIIGESIFLSKTFILPSITETINYLICKQQQASQTAISMACFYELLKKYNLDYTNKLLSKKSIDEKYSILFNECSIDVGSYPLSFWRGVACYRKLTKINSSNNKEEFKNKLIIDTNLPFFTKDQDFLFDILNK